MKLTAKLAQSQLKTNRKRAVWTILGIALSTAMITAVFGFAVSGIDAVHELVGQMRDVYTRVMWGVGAILTSIIMASAVIVISNAFRVSAGERLTQFGILKSVGATKRQIAETIMYESLYLSAISIPIGVVAGLLVQFTATGIANYILAELAQADVSVPTIGFVVAWQAIIVSAVAGFATVLLSAWLPARKAAKIPAINAIRKTGDVKVKKTRSNRLVKMVFGFEGVLAVKSLKRSKRNFRATVVSLTISIVMFIAASSFGAHLNRMTNIVIPTVDANVIGNFQSTQVPVFSDDQELIELIYQPISNEIADEISAMLREIPNTRVFGVGVSASSFRVPAVTVDTATLSRDMRNIVDPENTYAEVSFNFTLVTICAEEYAELARVAGVPYGSNILINHYRRYVGERWMEFTPFEFDNSAEKVLTAYIANEAVEVPIHGMLTREQTPEEILYLTTGRWRMLAVVVPRLDSKFYSWFVQADNPAQFTGHMRDVLDELTPAPIHDDIFVSTHVRNLTAEQNSDRNIVRLVMVFVFGFVGMLTLIGLTNVISTISTNVRSRSREFAMLKSTGMTNGGINRMLNLESILCSVKSLLYGLPLGILASFLVYRVIMMAVGFDFIFPWMAVLQCVLAVFVITWVTMRFAAARLKGESIVDSIRNDM